MTHYISYLGNPLGGVDGYDIIDIGFVLKAKLKTAAIQISDFKQYSNF